MPEIKTEISEKEPLNIGDVIEFHYKYPFWAGPWTYGSLWQIKLIEKTFEDKGYRILSVRETETHIEVRFEIGEKAKSEMQTAGLAVTAGIIAGIVAIGGLFLWLSLDKVYKITSSPVGATASISLAVIAAVLLLMFFIKGRS